MYRMYDTSEFNTLQLDDVPQTLDPAEGRGRVLSARWRGDGDGDVICAGLRLSTTTL